MTITITIHTSDAAYVFARSQGKANEVAGILAEVARRFYSEGPYNGPVVDIRGQSVGHVAVVPDGNDLLNHQ